MLLGVKVFPAFICKCEHKLCQTCTVSEPRMAHRPLLLPLKGKLIGFKAQLWSAVAGGGAYEEEQGGSHIFCTSYNWTPSQFKAFQVQQEKNSLWGFLEWRTITLCTVLEVRIPCCRLRYHQRTGKKKARCARPTSIKRLVGTLCSLIEKKNKFHGSL